MAAVLDAGELGVQTLQRLREARVGNAEKRVVVTSHQDVGEEGKLEALAGRAQPGEEVFAVLPA
jgi:hypothetical protein